MRAQTQRPGQHTLWLALCVLIALNVSIWASVRDVQSRWLNVPPAPSHRAMSAAGLGDRQLAYRIASVTLQNLGNVGGRAERLQSYDYNNLKNWMLMTWQLDPISNYVPYLAAFYFGAVDDKEKLKRIVDYLELAGSGTEGQKWRWMAQAAYIARYKLNDMDRAYDLATKLAASPEKDLPDWARQMPAVILNVKGDREAAYALMLNVMKSGAATMPAQEMNFMRHYICDKILKPDEAKANSLCDDVQW